MGNEKVLIVDCGSNFIKKAEEYFKENNLIFDKIKIEEIEKKDNHSYTHIIISGAPKLLTEVDPTPDLDKIKILLDYSLPTLGICFGHQLIGMYFGAKISQGKERRGDEEIRILQPSKLFDGIQTDKIIQQEAHLEEITLPNEFTLIATSKRTKNEAMEHKEKLIFSTQFHPEISGEIGQQIIKNFLRITQH